MAKSSGSKPSRIAAEERMLEQQREEIMRKTQELEQKLKVLPTVIEAASAGRAISPYTLGGGGRRTRAKGTQTPSRQRYAAQIKTMALLIALAIIFTLLWRVVPAT